MRVLRGREDPRAAHAGPGSVTEDIYLIVNADDFGYSAGVNRGIVHAYERGIVTSASLMVHERNAADAARYAREGTSLSVGVHIDLGEWSYQDGNWLPLYQRVALEDPVAVENEVREQISMFRDLIGRNPTHIDSHQHVHLREPVRRIVARQGSALNVPVRHLSAVARYCGAFYGQTAQGDPWPDGISTAALVAVIGALQPGVTELGCHPGYAGDRASTYARERDAEVETLCDPAIRRLLDARHIKLVSFDRLPELHA